MVTLALLLVGVGLAVLTARVGLGPAARRAPPAFKPAELWEPEDVDLWLSRIQPFALGSRAGPGPGGAGLRRAPSGDADETA